MQKSSQAASDINLGKPSTQERTLTGEAGSLGPFTSSVFDNYFPLHTTRWVVFYLLIYLATQNKIYCALKRGKSINIFYYY